MNFQSILAFSFIFSLIFTVFNVQATILINEIFPNPLNETNEWIEIYNPEKIELNLSEWKVGDEKHNNSLFSETSMITNSSYFLIIGEIANMSNITERDVAYFRTKSLGSKLNNDGGDNVTIYNSTFVLDRITYPSFPDNKEGYSWARMDNGSWFYCNSSTPGGPNIQNEKNETGDDNQTTINNTCDLYLWIKCDEVFGMGSNKYKFMIEDLMGGDFNPEVEYWIEDMFGNIIRSDKTNNTNDRQWTPPKITGTEAYFIRAKITDAKCNDTNISNNFAEKIIVVKGGAPISNSSISIIDVELGSDGKAKFGDNIEVKINVYRGDTNKNAIEVWLENADGKKAGKTNFNIYAKFSNYTLSVPLQISPNCDGALPNGAYFIRIEGLNGSDERQIAIEGTSTSLCKTIETARSCPSSLCPPCDQTNASEKTDEQPNDFEIVSWPDEIAKNAELVIKLRSKAYGQKNCTIYSYVYDGNKPLSLGFNGKKWLNTWNANKQEISANESTIITLINRISNDTEPGKYKLRVKIIYDGKEHEITRDIIVNEAEANKQQKSSNEEKEKGNSTSVYDGLRDNKTAKDNVSKNEIKIPTGRIVSKNEDNWFSIAINNMMNFFKSLFKL